MQQDQLNAARPAKQAAARIARIPEGNADRTREEISCAIGSNASRPQALAARSRSRARLASVKVSAPKPIRTASALGLTSRMLAVITAVVGHSGNITAVQGPRPPPICTTQVGVPVCTGPKALTPAKRSARGDVTV